MPWRIEAYGDDEQLSDQVQVDDFIADWLAQRVGEPPIYVYPVDHETLDALVEALRARLASIDGDLFIDFRTG